VAGILARGNAHANELADATLGDVRELMGTVYA
jgi:tryptophanyl-tRNA synthetase